MKRRGFLQFLMALPVVTSILPAQAEPPKSIRFPVQPSSDQYSNCNILIDGRDISPYVKSFEVKRHVELLDTSTFSDANRSVAGLELVKIALSLTVHWDAVISQFKEMDVEFRPRVGPISTANPAFSFKAFMDRGSVITTPGEMQLFEVCLVSTDLELGV